MLTAGIKRVDHVAIVVPSLDAALAFYQGVLGIVPLRVMVFPSEGVQIAVMPIGGAQGSAIELLEPTNPDTGVARFLAAHGPGLHHICLEVPDIDRALAELRAAGTDVLDAAPRPTAEGRGIFVHPRAAAGVLLELVEHDPTHGGASR